MTAEYHVRDYSVNTDVNTCVSPWSGKNGGMDSLASRLAHARVSRDLSQTALAKLADVSQGTIGNIEAGIRGGLQSLASIAMALQISYLWLRDGTGEMELPAERWLFSRALWQALKDRSADQLLPFENSMRGFLSMPPLSINDFLAEPGKQDPHAA